MITDETEWDMKELARHLHSKRAIEAWKRIYHKLIHYETNVEIAPKVNTELDENEIESRMTAWRMTKKDGWIRK